MKTMYIAVLLALAGLGGVCYSGSTVDQKGRIVDDINLPFAADPAVLGAWISVDFVRVPEDFTPGAKQFGGSLYLKELTFLPEGRTAGTPWWTWTKGVLMHSGDRTAARYEIRKLGNGTEYMFLEWKSGDYTIRHRTPEYYVLKRK